MKRLFARSSGLLLASSMCPTRHITSDSQNDNNTHSDGNETGNATTHDSNVNIAPKRPRQRIKVNVNADELLKSIPT